ncbi:hypothetical protein CRUP_014930, partial [Coryphaenoides rupestris]
RYVRRLVRQHADQRPLSATHGDLSAVARLWEGIRGARRDLQEVSSLVHGTKDEDQQMTQLLKDEELIKALVPSDPLDSSHVVLEVSAGRTTGGGLHHAAVQIAGDDVYRHLKHEGGTHRVTRIPHVGLSSRMQRIHTGTMAFELSIDAKDLRVDTFRSSGAGGQSVNTTDSAVRIVHLPTGMMVECQQSRSQLQNRDTAMGMLRARLHQSVANKETEKRLTSRKKQVGTRAQSERIRTYNFSQDRVTDHRTGYTIRDLKEFIRGGEALDDMICNVLEHRGGEALLDLVERERDPDGPGGERERDRWIEQPGQNVD